MELKDIAWNNARMIPGQNPDKWRVDACGARIHYDCYDQPNMMFGWHVDHIFPQSVLRDAGVPENLIDHRLNVRALNIKNNLSKSDNYPKYRKCYEYNGSDNVEVNIMVSVTQYKQDQIKELYKEYISDFRSGELNKKSYEAGFVAITSLATGGAEKLMVDLLPRLRERGFDVELLVFDGTPTPFRRQLEQAGIKIHDFGCGGSVYSPKNLFRLIPMMRRYDIVHTHNTAPQLFAAVGGVLCSVALCTTEHTTSNRRRGWKWYAAIDRWMYNRYRAVICISDGTREQLCNFIGRTKAHIETICNGIDVEKFASASPALLSESDGCIRLVQVAGFRYQKDQDSVIKALKHLPENYRLLLVGDGSRRAELESLVNDLGLQSRVEFLGVRGDVPQILKSADYVVMSSHWEGFGLAAAEGMAAGKPVLASDVDGLREVVGGAGVLFPHADPEALARAILDLEADPERRQAVANACRERAKQFDIAEMVNGYANLYKSL